MLASITPLGERGRQATWGITVTAFMIGSSAAGAAFGALLGAAGALALPGSLHVDARLTILAAAAVLAAVLDASRERVPGPRRQVDERWLDAYRGWVYGLGYGAQLGLGVTTVIASAALYVALLAAFLAGNAGDGAIVLGLFGALRGLSLLVAARVNGPRQLVALHAALARWRAPVWRGALALTTAIAAVAMAAAVS
jgi:hypothetical protein